MAPCSAATTCPIPCSGSPKPNNGMPRSVTSRPLNQHVIRLHCRSPRPRSHTWRRALLRRRPRRREPASARLGFPPAFAVGLDLWALGSCRVSRGVAEIGTQTEAPSHMAKLSISLAPIRCSSSSSANSVAFSAGERPGRHSMLKCASNQ
jgi:hypothetical protein